MLFNFWATGPFSSHFCQLMPQPTWWLHALVFPGGTFVNSYTSLRLLFLLFFSVVWRRSDETGSRNVATRFESVVCYTSFSVCYLRILTRSYQWRWCWCWLASVMPLINEYWLIDWLIDWDWKQLVISDVGSSTVVSLIGPDNAVQFGEPGLNHSQDVQLQVISDIISDSSFAL